MRIAKVLGVTAIQEEKVTIFWRVTKSTIIEREGKRLAKERKKEGKKERS